MNARSRPKPPNKYPLAGVICNKAKALWQFKKKWSILSSSLLPCWSIYLKHVINRETLSKSPHDNLILLRHGDILDLLRLRKDGKSRSSWIDHALWSTIGSQGNIFNNGQKGHQLNCFPTYWRNLKSMKLVPNEMMP